MNGRIEVSEKDYDTALDGVRFQVMQVRVYREDGLHPDDWLYYDPEALEDEVRDSEHYRGFTEAFELEEWGIGDGFLYFNFLMYAGDLSLTPQQMCG